MQNSITWVGMDVHAENIVLAAVRDSSDMVLFRAEFPNTPKGCERLAEKLARLHRLGELATVFVPTPAQEALRDLLRTREDAREDLLRRRHRLSKFLLRQGRRYTEGERWTTKHWDWIRAQTFTERNSETVFREYIVAIEQEVERIRRIEQQIVEESGNPEVGNAIARLRALRGVDTITATNKAVQDWPEVLAGDEVMATAILDRLLHRCHVLAIKGRSYRLKELEKLLK